MLLLIEDNGCGFDYEAVCRDIKGSMGLIAMEERVVSLGGILHIESRLGDGTTIRASIDVNMQASLLAGDKPDYALPGVVK